MLRRDFLNLLGSGSRLGRRGPSGNAETPSATPAPDASAAHRPRNDRKIAPRRTIKTIAYNGSVPGPLLRFREDQRVTIEGVLVVFNDTKDPGIGSLARSYLCRRRSMAPESGGRLYASDAASQTSQRYSFVESSARRERAGTTRTCPPSSI